MIITVFVTTADESDQWRAELLEHSWMQTQQPGELVRLVASSSATPLPMHSLARVVRTRPYSPHPYIDDRFPGYNQPGALLEWLFHERIDATLLLLDSDCLMLKSVTEELAPGEAIGNPWREWPKGEGPFGLSEDYQNLQAFCVNRDLKPSKIRFPLLIHSRDLKKMAARWLELTALIRCEVNYTAGKVPEAHQVAYTIAASEYRIPHKVQKLAVIPSDRKIDRPLLSYQQAVESPRGEIVWSSETYSPWSKCKPEKAKAGVGRQFLERLNKYVSLVDAGEQLRFHRPLRCHGVREARLPGKMLLEIPDAERPVTLNASAAAIWDLCDNQRTLSEIADVLEKRFDVARSILCRDIDSTMKHLHTDGAVVLEPATHDH